MLTAQDVSKALNILERLHNGEYKELCDPVTQGVLRADAFFASLPLKRALADLQVEIETCST